MLHDFFALFYPEICMACDETLYKHEHTICTRCIYSLPKTGFHLDNNNPVKKVFWGRIPIEGAASYYYFGKETRVQQLLHNLKYKGRKEVGTAIGKLYGQELCKAEGFKEANLILPVPLHPKKQKRRGYNQCDFFAEGLSESMSIPWSANVIERTTATDTQTRKSRFSRWQNVAEIFRIKDESLVSNRHLIIVDDVLTTGSTLEACARAVIGATGVKVSVATIAYA